MPQISLYIDEETMQQVEKATKEKLIEKIASIEDPKVLEEIDRWITSLIEAASSEPYAKEELDAVREGYSQYKSGDTLRKKRQTGFLKNGSKKNKPDPPCTARENVNYGIVVSGNRHG